MAWGEDTHSQSSKSSTSATSHTDTTESADTTEQTSQTDTDTDTDTDTEDEPDPESEDEDEPEVEDEPDPAAETDPEPEPAAEDETGTETETPPAPDDDGSAEAEPESADEHVQDVPKQKTTKSTLDRADTSGDPAVPPQSAPTVAVVVNTATPAQSSPSTVADALTTEQDGAAKPTLITAIVNVVTSMIDWAHQKADPQPGDAPPPPFLWALLSFARRELDNLFAARNNTSNSSRSTAATSTSLALTEGATTTALVPSYSPWINPQVSASTNFVSWVTGPRVYPGNSLLANTLGRFQVYGTDVGVMWDNGMVDDPSTPDINEHQVLIAVGDTFGAQYMKGRHIYNTLFRSSDDDLSDGMNIPNGEWFNGNMFGGAPLSQEFEARPIINRPIWAPSSITLIPTAGVSVPTEVTKDTPFGTIQYVSFMSVTKWGQAGRWTTNYSAVAYSTDNGENFKVAPESVRYNSFLSGNRNFQQSAYVKGDDGYVYVYGTPNGRQGAAYLARVSEENILDVSEYEYYKKASTGWFGSSTPARWVKGSPSSASAIIGKSGGLLGFTKPGYTVSEMSVQYNEYLKKYVVLYGDQANRIVMRTADTPEGVWSDATVLMNQQTGGIYAPMLHPWSPATQGTGSELYWNLSLWSEYNIMLMKTDLSKI